MRPLELKPVFKEYLWGGERLKYLPFSERHSVIAEAWMMSCHENGESTVISGEHKGEKLGNIIKEDSSFEGAEKILVKLIDAKDDLSVQVHPEDEYALKNENDRGKYEAWYIIDCTEDAEIVLGFSEDTCRDTVSALTEEGKLMSILRKVRVKKGDVFGIEPGTVHAIGSGVFLAEVQRSSDVTYRLYDYGRTDAWGKKRELHVEKALDVMNYSSGSVLPTKKKDGMTLFPENPYFEAFLMKVRGSFSVETDLNVSSVIVLEGECRMYSDEEELSLKAGSSILIPKHCKATFIGESELLISSPK